MKNIPKKIKDFVPEFLKGLSLYLALSFVVVLLYNKVPVEAFIGLIGVLTGSLISYFTVKEGFKHTSSKNKIQRSVEIKKSIYFKASESFAKMTAILASIPQMDLKKFGADSALIDSLQKIDLIAEIELINKINVCSSYYQTSLQEMFFDKMEIDNINNNAKYALNRHSEYLELMKLGSGNLKDLNEKMDKCLECHSDITKDLPQKMLNLTKKSMEHTSKFGSLLSDCVPYIREDIENPFSNDDKETYKDFTHKSINTNLKSGIKFLEKLSDKIEKFDFPNL